MRIRGINLDQTKINEIKNTETYNLYCYTTSLVIEDDNNIIFPNKSIINIDGVTTYARGLISKIKFNDDTNTLIFVDCYDYSILSVDITNKIITINENEGNIFTIMLEDDHKKYENPEYPIFTTEIEYISDTSYVGRLYAEFSPITRKNKYLILTEFGSLNYINAKFTTFIEDSSKSSFFNLLGVITEPTFVIEYNIVTFKCTNIYTLKSIEDNNINLVNLNNELKDKKVSYSNIVDARNYDFSYILVNPSYLIYDQREDRVLSNVNITQLTVLRNLTQSELEYYTMFQVMTNFKEKENYSNIEVAEWNARLKEYKKIIDKYAIIMKTYDGLVYIDKTGNIYQVAEIDKFLQYMEYINNIINKR